MSVVIISFKFNINRNIQGDAKHLYILKNTPSIIYMEKSRKGKILKKEFNVVIKHGLFRDQNVMVILTRLFGKNSVRITTIS